MELQTEALKRELQNVQQKEENKAYAKTWENNATLETHDPIARVAGMMEKPKKQDGTLGNIEIPCAEISAGRPVLHTIEQV